VTLRRAHFTCRHCRANAHPLDDRLGVDGLVSPHAQRLLCVAGVGRSFEEAFHVARMVERAARQATFIRLLGGAPQMTLHDLMSPEDYRRMEEVARAAGESVEDVLARSL